MAPIADQPVLATVDAPASITLAQKLADVPGQMADRIGALYADEERRDRTERTERLIREAQTQQ